MKALLISAPVTKEMMIAATEIRVSCVMCHHEDPLGKKKKQAGMHAMQEAMCITRDEIRAGQELTVRT